MGFGIWDLEFGIVSPSSTQTSDAYGSGQQLLQADHFKCVVGQQLLQAVHLQYVVGQQLLQAVHFEFEEGEQTTESARVARCCLIPLLVQNE